MLEAKLWQSRTPVRRLLEEEKGSEVRMEEREGMERNENKPRVYSNEKNDGPESVPSDTSPSITGHICSHKLNADLIAKRTKWRTHPVNFHQLINNAVRDVLKIKAKRSVDWNVRVMQSSSFFTDKSRLLFILHHILKHVVRSQDSNKEEKFVDIEVATSNKEVIIEIVDNGKGISPNTREKIYHLFTRILKNTPSFNKGILLLNDGIDYLLGCITIYSSPGIGTQYTIKLPNKPQYANDARLE